MIDSTPNYRRRFWKSRHHLWLALLTLGLGFATGEPLGLLAGATVYALGLVFLPDSGLFRRAIDAQTEASRAVEAAAKLAGFRQQQSQLLATLSAARLGRYQQLTGVCRDIETASRESEATTGLTVESGLRKLDELVWTYLRMLAIEQSLDVYLETERKERVPELVTSLQQETQTLARELDQTKPVPPARPSPAHETRSRLLASQLERLATLQQRLHRIDQAHASVALVRSEQERLVEQVKLIRADAIAAKNADALSARIDLSIAHLAATNKWLSELSDFQDLTQQIPDLPARVGFAAPVETTPPRLPRATSDSA